MKLSQIMNKQVIHISPDESVSVAARTLTHYNIGALPVCDDSGKLCGVITDRDVVTRCIAAGGSAENTKVRQIMSGNVVSAAPDMDTAVAAHLMGRQQIRRLPVVENGRLCGIVSLGDLAVRDECNVDAGDALGDICHNISSR